MKQIAEDETLAPVPRTARGGARDPNAPKRYFIMREYFPWCGHYAKYAWTEIETEGNEDEYMNNEEPGRCYGCAHAMPGMIEKMKARGEWDGNEDPWGEREKINSTSAGSAGAAASAPFDPESLIHPAYRMSHHHDDDDDDQRYASDEEYDTSQAKNKGVSGRPSHPEDEDGYDDDDDDHHHPYDDDRYEREGYSDDERLYNDSPPPRHPMHTIDHHRRDYLDQEPEDRFHGSRDATPDFDGEEEVPPPDFRTVPPPRREAPAAPDEISEEMRKRLGLPAGLSNAQVKSILARKEAEARDAMRQHSSGALDEAA